MIDFHTQHWTCGDGCCSDYLTEITVDDADAGTYSFFDDHEAARILYDQIKAARSEHTFKTVPELYVDDDGEKYFEYVSYINDVRLGVLRDSSFVHGIFEALGVNYTEVSFEADYEHFRKHNELLLEADFYTKYNEF